jgi:hypothetical protein
MIEAPLSNPFAEGTESARYTVKPREHRVFHTALDAGDLFTSKEPATITWALLDSQGALTVQMPVASGVFAERCDFAITPRFRPVTLERSLRQGERVVREERADFSGPVPKLPDATYPETMLPFLLRGHPLDGERRSLHAWICDRFVAKVYYEVHKKRTSIRVPAGRFETTEIVMYPDINDWVKLGSVITTLIKPFLPKYHMWFEPSARGPHKLVRFEGSYGPPGAPEIVLELV